MFWFFISIVIKYFFVILFIFPHKLFFDVFDLLFSKNSFFDTFLGVFFEDRWVSLNLFIHFWLGKKWLILLIMTKSSITDKINEDVFFELLTILNSYLHTMIKKIGLISINMNDWSSNNFSNFGTMI